MSDLKERVRKEYGDKIKELVAGVMLNATLMNAVEESGYGFEFINLIIEELGKLDGRTKKPEECEKDESSPAPTLKELKCVKAYKIDDLAKLKDLQIVFEEDEKFVKKQLAKAVMESMSIERAWDCLGNIKITASIKVQK